MDAHSTLHILIAILAVGKVGRRVGREGWEWTLANFETG